MDKLSYADPNSPNRAQWFTWNGKPIGKYTTEEKIARRRARRAKIKAREDNERQDRLDKLQAFYDKQPQDTTPIMRGPRENETPGEYAMVQDKQHKLLDENPQWDYASPEYAGPVSPFDV